MADHQCIIFDDIQNRNKFIKLFDESFSNAEIGRILGLARETVRCIRNDLKINKFRKYVTTTCPRCKKQRQIRKDELKESGNYCRNCSKTVSPKNQRLGEKVNIICIKCGKDFLVKRRSLLKGTVMCRSCRTRETSKKEYGLSTKIETYNRYKARSKKKKIKFDIQFDEFTKLTSSNCYYCGSEPSTITKNESGNGDYIYNGLDKIRNNEGYTKDNVVPCCKICNYAKNTMELSEFYNWINKIYRNLYGKGVLNES